ncbi:MAG: tRNA uracil 4-sulfurtransferase ThiI [Spirochaetota bacterium]
MGRALYLIRLGEIFLKGQNRAFFEKRLKKNIRWKLKDRNPVFRTQKGRIFLEVDADEEAQAIEEALGKTMGIVGFSRAVMTAKDYPVIEHETLELVSKVFDQPCSFKIEARRSDKSYPLTSYQIASSLGGKILETFDTSSVDVHSPDVIVYVEIRDRAYVYLSTSHAWGPGGLPVGAAGKGLLMLSGGIDSPIAGYMMASRGLRQEAVYFHTYPFTSDEALEKVKTLASILSPYTSGLKLHVIPFTAAQLHIKNNALEEEHTLLMRYCMIRVADTIARLQHAQCLITGESLSQVASQTIESLAFTESASSIPILRPLIGTDKEAIIKLANKIGTYETSILPYEDCCTVFSPKHPVVRPDKEQLLASVQQLDIESLLEEAARERETVLL